MTIEGIKALSEVIEVSSGLPCYICKMRHQSDGELFYIFCLFDFFMIY